MAPLRRSQRGGHSGASPKELPPRESHPRKARPVFLANQPGLVEYSNSTPPRSRTAPLLLRNGFDAPRGIRTLPARGVLRTSTPITRGRPGRPSSLQRKIIFRGVSPVQTETSNGEEEQNPEEESSDSSDSEPAEEDPLETPEEEEEEPFQEEPEDMELDSQQEEEDPQLYNVEDQDEEVEFLRGQYLAYLDAFEQLQEKYDDVTYQEPRQRKKLCRQAISLHNNFLTVHQGLTQAYQRLKLSFSGEDVTQHAEIMAELEDWIEENGELSNVCNNSSNAISLLQKSSLLNKTATDKGTIKMDTGDGVVELDDTDMPKGFFDPRITDKSLTSAVRKTISEIELSEFDGTLNTTSWDFWWKTFYEAIHRYPDTVVPESVRIKFLKKYIKGQARKAIRLDDPLTCNGVAVYSRIIRSLHQKYGRIQLTSNDANRKIVNLKLEDNTKTGISGFLTDLYNNTLVYIQTGVSREAAFGVANSKLMTVITDGQRCRMLDALQQKHSTPLEEYKKFLDYENWINADLSTRIERYSDKKGEKRKHGEQGGQSGNRKGYFNSKKPKYDQPSSMSKVFHVTCKLHKGRDKVTHKAVDCKLPEEVRKKLCTKLDICYICQEGGHSPKKCSYKEIVLLATSGGRNKKNQPEGKEGKGKKRKHKKESAPQPSAQKPAEVPQVKTE